MKKMTGRCIKLVYLKVPNSNANKGVGLSSDI